MGIIWKLNNRIVLGETPTGVGVIYLSFAMPFAAFRGFALLILRLIDAEVLDHMEWVTGMYINFRWQDKVFEFEYDDWLGPLILPKDRSETEVLTRLFNKLMSACTLEQAQIDLYLSASSKHDHEM